MIRKVKGLTLVELMVTLAVLAILSAIVYPSYTSIVQKSSRSDGRSAVAMIAAAQERYFTLNGSYANTMASLSLSSDLIGGYSEGGKYSVAVTATTTSYTATATATGVQVDDSCDSLSLNQLGVKSETGSGCW